MLKNFLFVSALLLLGGWGLCGCSDDAPETDDQEQVVDDDKGDNTDDEGGTDDGGSAKPDDGDDDTGDDITSSLYKPFKTDKVISHIYILHKGRQYDDDYVYDSEGRIIEQRTIINKKEETLVITSFEYNGDFIDMSYYPQSYGVDDDYKLNEDGYAAEIISEINIRPIIPIYDENNYWIGYGKEQTLFYTEGNLTRDTQVSKSYTCTYTDYLNDSSIDLTTNLVRQAYDNYTKEINLPTDVLGKRSRNLPKQVNFIGTDSWIDYDYEFDLQGRVTKILATYYNYVNGEEVMDPVVTAYEITYVD